MTVVHIAKAPFTHYIGRQNRGYRYRAQSGSLLTVVRSLQGEPSLASSPLQNPFRITPERPRDQVLVAFETYARKALMVLIAALPEDAILGCWCAPEACHGDVIVKLWKEIHKEETE